MKCPTYLLDDIPPPEDQLVPHGEGAHERVARSIADLVHSEEGGQLIGLEGRWGSGKTTIINLMRKRLESDTTLFAFDAWAHERDPLRRSFLESPIRHFQQIEWVEKEYWDSVLEKLSKRRKVTETRTVPQTTTFGKSLVFSALLVPLGTALVAGSFQRGVTFNTALPINEWFLIGVLLSIAPFFAVLVKLVCTRIIRSRATPDRDSHNMDWALLTGNATSKTNQDTTETPEPTSIEFEDEFRSLMGAALSESESRKAVLVVDNMDRVDPADALSIWSTLQTFLQDRSTEVQGWFRKIWIIVPYDKSGLRRLWIARGADSGDGANNSSDGIAESFIDKSFQVRFEVPPPVLSNWKLYLSQLVTDALPQHAEDAHDFYRVYNHCVAKKSGPPTPRELKLYVNQIGALHRQWEHQYPVEHLAYYAALQRGHETNQTIREALLRGDVPDGSLAAQLAPNLRATLAGLLFNVDATVGEQLLLSEPIYRAVAGNNVPVLKQLEMVHQSGFWAVLEEVIESRIRDEGPAAICSAARCLNDSNLLRDDSKQDVRDTIDTFAETADKVESWSPLTDQTVSGISAACGIVKDTEFSGKMISSVRRTLEEISDGSGEPRPETDALIGELSGLARQIRELGHEPAPWTPFPLPAMADEWVENCAVIAEHDEWLWALFRPQAPFSEIAALFSERVTAGEISEAVRSAVKVTNSSGIADSWNELLDALERRLNQNVNAQEGTLLLRTLAVLNLYEPSESEAAYERLSEPGHLLNLLYQAQAEGHLACRAWCVVTFLQRRPDARRPSAVGNSEAGYADLEGILSVGVPGLAEKVVGILTDLDDTTLLFSVVDARDEYDPFLIECLRLVADSKNPLRLYSADETINRWMKLNEILCEEAESDRFSNLVQTLCVDTDLVSRLQRRGFDTELSGLYLEVLQVDAEQEFVAFCRAGLEKLDRGAWASALNDEGYVLELLIELQERNAEVSLQSPYQDAVVDYADTLLSGDNKPSPDLVDRRAFVLSPLSQNSRRVLRDRLRDAIIEKGVKYAGDFIKMFGDEIAEPSLLKNRNDVVAKVCSAVVRERLVSGLAWLHRILKKDPAFLEAFPDPAVTDFKERIQSGISQKSDESDQAGELIREIADILGITPLPAKRPSKKEPAGQDMKDDTTA